MVCAGTRTPGWVASTSRCGVMSLSEIHSYRARNRYGRWLLIRGASVIALASVRHGPQVAFLRGEAAGEAGVAEDPVAVVLDALAVARQAHAQRVQAPDDRGHEIGRAHV